MAITFTQLGGFGRRGNMLFQAAAIISLAIENNDDYIFPHCELENTTNIPLNKFSNNIKYNFIYKEPHFHYSKILYKQNLNICDSYLQSYKYFLNNENKIKQLLISNDNILKQFNKISVHIRRTDYLINNNCYQILDRNNYYDKAMELFPNSKFLIFSDDIAWCKQNFTGNDFEFSEGNPGHIDMKLMSLCDHNIIANSSFSWWGAFLNTNKNSKVVAPDKWFGPKLSSTHNTKDLYLPGTIRI